MRYFLCVLFPPLAVISTGRIFQAVLSFLLTLMGWIPGVLHAFFIVNDWKNEKRFNELKRRYDPK